MLLQNSYLIVKKGGLVGGYGGIISFIPELQLSTYVQSNYYVCTVYIILRMCTVKNGVFDLHPR